LQTENEAELEYFGVARVRTYTRGSCVAVYAPVACGPQKQVCQNGRRKQLQLGQ
jgi:hypothetical protein